MQSNSKDPPELSKYIEQEPDHATTEDFGILNGSDPVEVSIRLDLQRKS